MDVLQAKYYIANSVSGMVEGCNIRVPNPLKIN